MSEAAQDFYVYGWYNHDWGRWFYVGKGSGYRYRELRKRSADFTRTVNSFYCTPHVLARTLDEQTALDAERALKATLWSLGEPITDGEKKRSAQRQREGIERAKLEGKYKGCPSVNLDEELFEKEYRDWKNGNTAPKFMMKRLGLKPATFWRRVKDYEIKHGIRKEE